jgi:hypothetical protein
MSLRSAPKLQEDLNRKFFRARRIGYDPRDNAGDVLILSAKDCFEIEGRLTGPDAGRSLTWCVHNTTTPPDGEL